jgi:hypothetical protein
MDINSNTLIITLTIIHPNSPIKRKKLSYWIKSQDQNIHHMQENHFICQCQNILAVHEPKYIHSDSKEYLNVYVNIRKMDY